MLLNSSFAGGYKLVNANFQFLFHLDGSFSGSHQDWCLASIGVTSQLVAILPRCTELWSLVVNHSIEKIQIHLLQATHMFLGNYLLILLF